MEIKDKKISEDKYDDLLGNYANDLWAMFNLLYDDILEKVDDSKSIKEVESNIIKLLR